MNLKITSWLAGAVMLGGAVASNAFHPVAVPQRGFKLDALIPLQFAGWQVDRNVIPIAPTPDVQENLDKLYGQIVSRTYVNARGDRMMLVVAYGGDQSDSLKAHRQEVCYAAQGFTIRDVHRDHLNLPHGEVPLVRVNARKADRSEPVSYWFTMGERVVIDRADRLFAQIGYGLGGTIPDGLLVRVSNISGDVPASYAAQDDFLRSLLQAMPASGRRRLAGLDA